MVHSRIAAIGCIVALVLVATFGKSRAADTERKLVDIPVPDLFVLNSITELGLDVWEIRDGAALAYIDAGEEARLAAEAIAFVPSSAYSAVPDPKGTPSYPTFDEYVAEMQAWSTTYPEITSLFSMGQSGEGRELWVLRISDNPAVDEGEPEVLLMSLQHAREWLSGTTLQGIAEHILSGYGSDPDATAIVDGMQLYVMLVSNPDGYVYTHTTQRLWRKNRTPNNDGTFGVDLNRNWPYQWNTATSQTSSNLYRGPSPLSEPENIALNNWIASRGEKLLGILNYHTYGQLIMYSWAYTTADPPNKEAYGPVIREMKNLILAAGGATYTDGPWAQALGYVGGGTTDDYVHAVLGVPTITLELRPATESQGGFTPPTTFIEPTLAENIPAAIYFLKWVLGSADGGEDFRIANIRATAGATTIRFDYETNQQARCAIEFGPTPELGQVIENLKLNDLRHITTLTGLTSGSVVHARVRADRYGGGRYYSSIVRVPLEVQPASPTLLAVTRGGDHRVRLSWSPQAGVAGFRIQESLDRSTWTTVADESMVLAAATSIELNIDNEFLVRHYRIVAVSATLLVSESAPSDVYSILPTNDAPGILLVDGYDRWNAKAPPQGGSQDFLTDVGVCVAAYPAGFESCANEALGSAIDISGYGTLIWMLGDESTVDRSFTQGEQAIVREFLEVGGNLFVTGSATAFDLGRTGAAANDIAFLRDYLGAGFVAENPSADTATGAGAGTPFGSRVIRFNDSRWGTFGVASPDTISAQGGGIVALTFAGGAVAGVHATRQFGNSAETGRVVFFGFPFELILTDSAREGVMADVLDYFAHQKVAVPESWMLLF